MQYDKNFARLERLRLNNFRAFSQLDIGFAPITLLTGANSSGKSSVLSAIASILQTRAGSSYPFDLVPNGTNCSLGGFRDIVHGGSARANFGLGITVQKGTAEASLDGTYRYSPVGDHILPAHLSFQSGKNSLEVEWQKQSRTYRARYLSAQLSDELSVKVMRDAVRAVGEIYFKHGEHPKGPSPQSAEQYFVESIEKAKKLQGNWYDLKARRQQDLKSELSAEVGPKQVMDTYFAVVRDLLAQFTYVGPVRAYPERHYALIERGALVDPRGELSVLELAKWRRSNPRLFRQVVNLLTGLKLAETLRPAPSQDDILRMMIRPQGHRRYINYADTGFGISQVLPILIKDVALGSTGTLLINQPEVHLHPSAQAQLANHFVERLANRRYIIETHSEYLINRLRLLVAEGKLPADHVQIYFFDLDKLGDASAHPIRILPNGNLKGAPKAFFSTYSADALRLVSAGFDQDS